MCGIAAYIGQEQAAPYLFNALKRLERRGYDSFGFMVLNQEWKKDPQNRHGYSGQRAVGAFSERSFYACDYPGNVGLGHTRWATHGIPSAGNAHPIAGGLPSKGTGGPTGVTTCWVVHNGIVKNYEVLKTWLQKLGYKFWTDTDTEVIANLLDMETARTPLSNYTNAVERVLKALHGDNAFVALSTRMPKKLLLATSGPPLCFTDEGHVASELNVLPDSYGPLHKLQAGGVAVLRENDPFIFSDAHVTSKHREKPQNHVSAEWPPTHHMLREIRQQPALLREVTSEQPVIEKPSNIILFGCGSSWHVGLMAKFYFDYISSVVTEVDYASELVRLPLVARHNDKCLAIPITQSGETADTLRAMKICHKLVPMLAVTNTQSSSLGELTHMEMQVGAGEELGVAATKTFTMSCVGLLKLAYSLVDWHNQEFMKHIHEVLPAKIHEVLDKAAVLEAKAPWFAKFNNTIFLARGIHFPVALEGALKMKEVALVHAEAMPAAEMKHGPIALIDENTLSIFVIGWDDSPSLQRSLGNMREIKARGGPVAVFCMGDTVKQLPKGIDFVFELPESSNSWTQPLVANVALQLLAYYVAVAKGLNPDRPRNLAKCVTVD